jgi:hypothetical protein
MFSPISKFLAENGKQEMQNAHVNNHTEFGPIQMMGHETRSLQSRVSQNRKMNPAIMKMTENDRGQIFKMAFLRYPLNHMPTCFEF